MTEGTCGTARGLSLRPELQATYDHLNAQGDPAYAVCRTADGAAWEVITREGNIYSALDAPFLDHDEAMSAGAAWLLAALDREPLAP